jgi:putative tricarboxylic transport membrane protein
MPRSAAILFLTMLATIAAAAAPPEWKPERAIEIVVGVTPGGPADTSARMIQKILQDKRMVTVPVSVSNRAGANNALAWIYLNAHAGDAHFIAMTLPNIVTNRITGAHDLSFADVTPLAQLNSESIVFSVKADSAIKNGAELIARLKANPTAVSIAFSNIGSANHIGAGIVMKTAGFDVRKLKFVAFKGASEAVTALMGGHVDVVASSGSTVAPQVESGALRLIAVAAPKRLRSYPAVPTWREQGVAASFSNWRGVIGPKGMSAAQIAYWDDLLGKIVRTEEWTKEVAQLGWESEYLNSADSRKFLERQNEELKGILGELALAKTQ